MTNEVGYDNWCVDGMCHLKEPDFINLYWVCGCEWKYGVYVFTTSRNRAKSMAVGIFDESDIYTDMRCKTLKKDVGGRECVVDCELDDGYEKVVSLGFQFKSESEE
jgi:hypothetical protein